MKLSLFTPTHDPGHLLDVLSSIQQQGYDDWEWVICPNGEKAADATAFVRNNLLPQDNRIRCFPYDGQSTNIGALKRFACEHCSGDVLVELDHDDLLVPLTLPKIARAAQTAGFIYSDSAVFEPDMKTWGYHPAWGWENYEIKVYGLAFTATRTFDINPRVLCEVYYCPDHVRAWRTDVYKKTGGHDPALPVADDHDLICRTYLSGTEFKHIGGCGYLYRYHQGNTVKMRGADIQKHTAANRRKYLWALIDEWCRRQQLPKINLTDEYRAGRWDPNAPDVFARSNEESVYGRIVANDILQFVPPKKQVSFFNRCWQCLVPGGWLTVLVPSPHGLYADMSPLHRSRFNRCTFLLYSRREFAANIPEITCRYDLVECSDLYPSEAHKQYDLRLLRADLAALKGQRWPGPQLI